VDWYKGPSPLCRDGSSGGVLWQGRNSAPMARPTLTLVWPFPVKDGWRRPRWEIETAQPGSWLEPLCEGFQARLLLNQAWLKRAGYDTGQLGRF